MKCPLICHQESIKNKPLSKCRKIFLHVFFVDHFRSNSPWYSVIFHDIPWYPIIIAHCFYHVVGSIFIPWIFYSYSIYMPYIHWYPSFWTLRRSVPASKREADSGQRNKSLPLPLDTTATWPGAQWAAKTRQVHGHSLVKTVGFTGNIKNLFMG